MLFRENSTIDSEIIQMLSLEGGMTASTLLHSLHEKGTPVSLQNIYKVLRQLQDKHILIKQGKKYSIRLAWILDMVTFVDQLQQTYFDEKGLQELLPKEDGERKKWHFSRSVDFFHFWINLHTTIIAHENISMVLSQFPHPWIGLLDIESWNKCKQFFHTSGIHLLTIYKTKSYMSQYIHAIVTNPSCETTHFDTFNECQWKYTDRYMTVVGDYIITAKFSPELLEFVDTMNAVSSDAEELYIGDLYREFAKKQPITLTIKRDTHSSRLIQKKFTQIFGPPSLYTKKER